MKYVQKKKGGGTRKNKISITSKTTNLNIQCLLEIVAIQNNGLLNKYGVPISTDINKSL